MRRVLSSCVLWCVLTASQQSQAAVLRSLSSTDPEKSSEVVLPGELPRFDECRNSPTLHHAEREEVRDYMGHYKGFVHNWYPQFLHRDTLIEDASELYTPSLRNAELIFWASTKGLFEMSLYNSREVVEGDHYLDAFRTNWKFLEPSKRNLDRINKTIILRGDVPHVAFFSIRFAEYQHLLLDHLGYLAYLRQTLPPHTRILLAETQDSQGLQRKLLEELDPEFAARVDWITCGRKGVTRSSENEMAQCNQRVQIRGGGTLKVLIPQSSTKHEALLELARDWIYEKMPPSRETSKKTIIYYRRSPESAQNGRLMDIHQEQNMLQIVRHMMTRFNRPEELVIFDGTNVTLTEQVRLFQSATLVFGPHGGGLVNLLFASMDSSPQDCQDRTKVLEFSTSPLTPEVQFGTLNRSYYNLMSTSRWLDYHHIWFTTRSTEDTTYINMDVFRNAILLLLGGIDRNQSYAIPQ